MNKIKKLKYPTISIPNFYAVCSAFILLDEDFEAHRVQIHAHWSEGIVFW